MREQFEHEKHYSKAGEVRNRINEVKIQLTKQRAKMLEKSQNFKVIYYII